MKRQRTSPYSTSASPVRAGRWFAQNGPTLDYGEQASRTMSAVLLWRYL